MRTPKYSRSKNPFYSVTDPPISNQGEREKGGAALLAK
jgi:hypothetical protein